DAEDTGFLLYTSGTTGKPKGVKHSCGAYAAQAAITSKWVFDLHPNDIFFSTADIGWITGHSYTLYGPLLNGVTTLWYEGSPYYPEPDRWWDIIEKYGANVLYTAPTAIRALRQKGTDWLDGHDLSSLRILGSVGEPIDPDTWNWFFEEIGGGRCPIVDTYWQTETGGILLTSLPGIGPFVPGVAGPALPGIQYDVLDATGEPVESEESGKVVQKHPFGIGMLRGIYKAPDKYKAEYWSEYGDEIYFSGDGGRKTEMEIGGQRLIEITGRIDDILEVSGHRLGTAEIEDAISSLEEIVEVAVVGKPHEVKGEVPAVFAIVKEGIDIDEKEDELKEKIVNIVREKVGPVATPEAAYFVSDVPRTESGKVIRRFLKGLVRDEELGDMTTASNPSCLKELAKKVKYQGPEEIDF
ncbi:MAG: AMP-binding protein, partial [Candidatus Hadarchaeia archaeon]